MNAVQVKELLGLQLHPLEGGYYRRSYQSEHCLIDVEASQQRRYCASSIYYMLSEDQPIGYLHRNHSDIVHCYQLGAAAEYFLIDAEAKLQRVILGPDLVNGHVLQLLVPGGVWKASRLLGRQFSLISEFVVPGFDYRDNEIAGSDLMRACYPQYFAEIAGLIKPADD